MKWTLVCGVNFFTLEPRRTQKDELPLRGGANKPAAPRLCVHLRQGVRARNPGGAAETSLMGRTGYFQPLYVAAVWRDALYSALHEPRRQEMVMAAAAAGAGRKRETERGGESLV